MRLLKAYRSPKIETIVVQHPWLENDTLYADIILPANTTMEVEDIVTNIRQGVQFNALPYRIKLLSPLASPRATLKLCWKLPRSWANMKKFTGGPDDRGPGEAGL